MNMDVYDTILTIHTIKGIKTHKCIEALAYLVHKTIDGVEIPEYDQSRNYFGPASTKVVTSFASLVSINYIHRITNGAKDKYELSIHGKKKCKSNRRKYLNTYLQIQKFVETCKEVTNLDDMALTYAMCMVEYVDRENVEENLESRQWAITPKQIKDGKKLAKLLLIPT